MSDIIYSPENKEIQFVGKISSFVFYNKLFPALKDFYSDNGKEKVPKFSFNFVKEFDALVVPNLIGLGILIKRAHNGQPIPLSILRISPTKFLDSCMFFDYSGDEKVIEEEYDDNKQVFKSRRKIGFNIYEFNKGLLGFYNNDVKKLNYNSEHKIHAYESKSYEYYRNYNEIKDKDKLESELDSIRTKISNDLKLRIKKHFSKILSRYNRPINDVNIILQIITELICNSKLYSYSPCIAMMQSKTEEYYIPEREEYELFPRTYISVSDVGLGFEGSFKSKPNFINYVSDNYKGSTENKRKLKNYLLIFDALHYSMEKERENLYTLLKRVIQNNGKMRIHYENVQVIFSSNRCKGCEVIPLKCSKCLLDNLNSDVQISPVRFFKQTYKGVHIEVELGI